MVDPLDESLRPRMPLQVRGINEQRWNPVRGVGALLVLNALGVVWNIGHASVLDDKTAIRGQSEIWVPDPVPAAIIDGRGIFVEERQAVAIQKTPNLGLAPRPVRRFIRPKPIFEARGG